MTTYLPKEVAEGLNAARLKDLKRKSRLRVVVDDEVFPILRFWQTGFSMEPGRAPRLRGLVDLYDGSQHLWQCLIITAAEEDGEIKYEFKRQTAAMPGPALDFVRAENAPVGYLPRQ